MAHYKRKKSKRNVVCTICTPYKWMGNTPEKTPPRKKRKFGGKRGFHDKQWQPIEQLWLK